jgi:hypothetical protein
MKRFVTIAAILFTATVLVSSCSPYYGVPRNPNYVKPTERHYKVRTIKNRYPNRPKKFTMVTPAQQTPVQIG